MLDDDPFDPDSVDDESQTDPGAIAEGKARDMEAELLSRHESPEKRLDERLEQLASNEASSSVSVPFWAAAIFANVGLLLISLGPMVAYFRGQYVVGAVLTVAGCFALYRTYTTYRSFRAQKEAEANEDGTVDEADSDDAESDETTSTTE